MEIKLLTKLTSSADVSSASEATPLPEDSPTSSFKFLQPQGPLRRSPSLPTKLQKEDLPVSSQHANTVRFAVLGLCVCVGYSIHWHELEHLHAFRS